MMTKETRARFRAYLRYSDALWTMHQRIQQDGYIEVHDHRFLVVARKPEYS